jgi:hypothetical protein
MYYVETTITLDYVQPGEPARLVHEGLHPLKIMLLDWLYEDFRVESGGLHLQSLRGSEILGMHKGLLFACERVG